MLQTACVRAHRRVLFFIAATVLSVSSAGAQSWQTLIDDEFIGPDGTVLTSHFPETNLPGGTWALGGSPGIILQGQAAHVAGSGPFQAFATIDARVSDGDIGQYWYAVPQGDNSLLAGGLIFRFVDANNFMLVHYYDHRVWLWKMLAGSLVHIAYADVAPAEGAWHWMAVRAIGPSLAVNWDGVDVIVLNDSTYQTATRHGMWFRNGYDPYSYIGTFRVRSQQTMLPPAITTVVASPNPLSMPIASTSTVTATAYAANGATIPTATYTWTSSNPSVAWVQSTTSNTAQIVATAVGTATLTVTGQSGTSTYQRTVPISVANTTAQAKQVLIYDDFIAPENSSLASHAPETNLSHGSWALGGTPTPPLIIVNNQAVHPNGPGTADAFATIDSKTPDADVGIYWYPNQSNSAGGVIFRYVSPTSYLLAHYWQEALQLWKMTPSGFVLLANAQIGAPSTSWHWLEIRGVGPQLTVNWDGVDKIQFTDSTNLLSTRHGLRLWSSVDQVSTIGTFVVKGTLPEPVTSVVVTPTTATVPIGGAQWLTAKGYGAGGTYVPSAFTWTADNNAEIISLQSPLETTVKAVGFNVGAVPVHATVSGGTANASSTITVIAKCMGLCVADTFAGAGTPLQSHTPDIANVMDGPWEVIGGPGIGAGNNTLKPTATGGTIAIGTINGGNNNGTIQADWSPDLSLTNPTFGLIARYVSNNEYYVATYENHQIKLFKRYVDGITQIGGALTYDDLHAQHRMAIKLDGPGISVLWDNVIKIQAVDSSYETATRHGVYCDVSKDHSSSLNTFQFVGAAKSVPVSAEIRLPSPAVSAGYEQYVTATSFAGPAHPVFWESFTWQSSDTSIATIETVGLASARVVGLRSGAVVLTATSSGGIVQTSHLIVSVPESDETVHIYDPFVGTVSTPLALHSPERYVSGAVWSVSGAQGLRLNDQNEVYAVRLDEIEMATIDSATADGTVSVNWRPYNSNQNANGGLVFRYTNSNSYWYAQVFARHLQLGKVTALGTEIVASIGITDPTSGRHQIAVLLDGPRIQVWLNGLLQIELTDSMNQSATKHGLIFQSAFDGASSLDDFTVNRAFVTPSRPPQPIFPCFNGFWPPSGAYWPTVGGSDTVTLSAPFECAWTAETTDSWIHLTTTTGIGDTYLEYTVDLNTGGQRTGSIVVNGSSYPVTQAAGGTLQFTFEVLNAFTQQPVVGASVALEPNYGGLGAKYTDNAGRVSYVVGGGPLRYLITKQGYDALVDSFNVTQADTRTVWLVPGEPTPGDPNSQCVNAVTPPTIFVASGGAWLNIDVSATPGCSWTATTSNTDWISFANAHGSGSASLAVMIQPASGGKRRGIVSIGGYSIAITQAPTIADLGTVRKQRIIEACDYMPIWINVCDSWGDGEFCLEGHFEREYLETCSAVVVPAFVNIVKVDILNDDIEIDLGPEGEITGSGQLIVELSGFNEDLPGPVHYVVTRQLSGAGKVHLKNWRENLPNGRFSIASAIWRDGSATEVTDFDVLGLLDQTTYGPMNEDRCVGPQSGTGKLSNKACADFAADPDWMFLVSKNGLGRRKLGVPTEDRQVKWDNLNNVCNVLYSFHSVSSWTGAYNLPLTASSVAVRLAWAGSRLRKSDRLLILGMPSPTGPNTIKSVDDTCPHCGSTVDRPHEGYYGLDNFDPGLDQCTSDVISKGLLKTIRLPR